MNETYSKNYFEKYAALTLTKVFGIKNQDIIQSDRPDLRIPSLFYGIEVTQAITPEEAVADIKKTLYGKNPFDRLIRNLEIVIKQIDYAIVRKKAKSRKYAPYLYNGLYIFSHCHNLDDKTLKNYLNSHDLNNCFFHVIYVNCIDNLYIYDCHRQQLSKVSFSLTELAKMNQEALVFEKTCYKKRRKIDL